ncbi:unnamed protein product [Cylicocyclus nassatus]|uniref:Uncharacterized protein n=1 Tax=Cylicocyclus nassatus TaxID=53992 RepID=A0AA36HG19_CYLNA|nr:unnamed protein product [Cylicocyclus nassatus]
MKPSLLTIVFLTGTVRSRNIWEVFGEYFGYGEGQSEENANSLEEKEENSNSIEEDDDRYRERFQWWKPVEGGGFEEINVTWPEDPEDEQYENEIPGEDLDNRVDWRFKPPHDPRTEEGYRRYLQSLEEWIHNISNQDHGFGNGGVHPSITQDVLFGHEELK